MYIAVPMLPNMSTHKIKIESQTLFCKTCALFLYLSRFSENVEFLFFFSKQFCFPQMFFSNLRSVSREKSGAVRRTRTDGTSSIKVVGISSYIATRGWSIPWSGTNLLQGRVAWWSPSTCDRAWSSGGHIGIGWHKANFCITTLFIDR